MINRRKPRAFLGAWLPRPCRCIAAAFLLLIIAASPEAKADLHGYPVLRENAATGSLEGIITDAFTQEPIMGVIITLEPGDLATFTFGDGRYRFSELRQGTYSITVNAEGYLTFFSTVQVWSGQTTGLNIALTPLEAGGRIQGTVIDYQTGLGVEGARIDVEPGERVAYTDSSGRYIISMLEPGTYTMTVSHSDYFSIPRARVSLSAGEIREENFILFREVGRIAGRVRDAETHKRVGRATVRSENGQLSTTTSAGGIYLLRDVPAGIYTLIFEASNYRSVRRTNVRVESSGSVLVNAEMEPTRPQVLEAMADPEEILIPEITLPPDDPAFSILLTASVEDPDGPEDILHVLVDLTPIGGFRAQRMYDNGTHGDQRAGDGVYSVRTTAAPDTPVGEMAFTVTATDTNGARGQAEISAHAYLSRQKTLLPLQVDVYTFRNRIPRQTLIISYQLLIAGDNTPASKETGPRAFPDTARLKGRAQPQWDTPSAAWRQEACVTTIEIESPDGTVMGPFSLTDALAETEISDADTGQWTYRVTTMCPEPQSYASSARGSGTGLIVGMVRDSVQQTGIDSALMQSDLGSTALTTEGRFLMIVPAGVVNLQASALSYADTTASGITVLSGETKEVDMDMVPLMIMSADQSTYIAGSTLGFNIQFFNPGSTQQVDAYFLILLPDGQTIITFDENIVPCVHTLNDGTPLEPVGLNIPFTTISIPADDFYTFTGVEPPGEYAIYIILTDPGGHAENAEEWVAWTEYRFVYQ